MAPDLRLVEMLARATLIARRQGRTLGVVGVSADLRGLLVLVGLGRVIRIEPGSGVEPGR